MTIVIAIASAVLSLIVLVLFWNKPITQQLFFLFIYLIGLTSSERMTALLPIYFVFSLIPFLKRLYRMSRMTFFLLFYLGIYVIIGLIAQDLFGTAMTFVSKIWQLPIFFIIFDSALSIKDKPSIKQLIIAFFFESVMGIYLLLTGKMGESNGMVRLVSGAQPITGNIAIVILPLLVYLFFKYDHDRKKKFLLLSLGSLFFIWCILSGTRGYTLIYALVLFYLFYCYWFKKNSRKISITHGSFLFLISLLIISVAIIGAVPLILDKFASILRLNPDVGIRTFENAAEWDFFFSGPWYVELFGIGLGGIAGDYPEFSEAILRQGALGMWNMEHYLMDAGALFHNLYADVLLNMGIIGLVVMIIANIGIWKRITKACDTNRLLKTSLHLYQTGFMIKSI